MPRPHRERCAECRLRKCRRPGIQWTGFSGRSSAEDVGSPHRRGASRSISGRLHTWTARFVPPKQHSPVKERLRTRPGSHASSRSKRSRPPVVAPCSSCTRSPLAAPAASGYSEQTAIPAQRAGCPEPSGGDGTSAARLIHAMARRRQGRKLLWCSRARPTQMRRGLARRQSSAGHNRVFASDCLLAAS